MTPSQEKDDKKQEELEKAKEKESNIKANQMHRDRGQRVRKLRGMLGLGVNMFADLVGISRVTLSFWENAKNLKLSYQGACKIVSAVKKEGVDCTVEWLWDNIGDPPRFVTKGAPSSQQLSVENESGYLFSSTDKEINFFLSANRDAVVIKIDTEKLSPSFEYGDIVAGLWQPTTAMRADGYCIIDLNNRREVKWVKRIANQKSSDFALLTPFPDTSEKNEKIQIDKVAPVIRLWRTS